MNLAQAFFFDKKMLTSYIINVVGINNCKWIINVERNILKRIILQNVNTLNTVKNKVDSKFNLTSLALDSADGTVGDIFI